MNRSVDASRDLSLPSPDGPNELALGPDGSLPPVLLGRATPEVAAQVSSFYRSVAVMLEAWLKRSSNANTQRTYRRSVLSFIEFLGISWPTFDPDGSLAKDSPPDDSWRFLQVSVAEVRGWRDEMQADGQAGATLNARLSAVSGFYRFLRETAATELKLPIQVPNPAHAQFIGRESPDPVDPTLPLGLSKARKLMSLPAGGDVFEARDRAILKTFLFTGIRIGTGCRLTAADFVDDPDDPKLLIEGYACDLHAADAHHRRVPGRPRRFDRPRHRSQRNRQPLERERAGVGQAAAARPARDQSRPEDRLQLAQEQRRGRLADAELAGGAAE